VVPGRYRTPLLVDGVAYVRHQNTSHPADWQRLADLFAEAGVAQQGDIWDIRRPDVPIAPSGGSDSTVDFVMRSGLNVAVAREAKWRPLSERTVAAFADGLNRVPAPRGGREPRSGWSANGRPQPVPPPGPQPGPHGRRLRVRVRTSVRPDRAPPVADGPVPSNQPRHGTPAGAAPGTSVSTTRRSSSASTKSRSDKSAHRGRRQSDDATRPPAAVDSVG
jgi:hypothetical protein